MKTYILQIADTYGYKRIVTVKATSTLRAIEAVDVASSELVCSCAVLD